MARESHKERSVAAPFFGVLVGVLGVVVGVLSDLTLLSIASGLVGVAALVVLLRGSGSAEETQAERPDRTAEKRIETPVFPENLEPESVTRSMMECVSAHEHVVASHIWLEDPSSGTLRQIHAVGPMPPSATPVSLEDKTLGAASRTGLPQLAVISDPSVAGKAAVWRYCLRLETDDASGVAAVDFESSVTPDAARLENALAPVQGALAGALAVHVARTEIDIASHLVETARELSRILDPDEVIETTLDRAIRLSDAATASIMLLEPDTNRLVIVNSVGLPPEVVAETSIAAGEGIAGWVLMTGQPLLVEDLPNQRRGRRRGVRSAVSVPLGDDDGVLGVINVGSRSFPAKFTASHLRALETLGKQAALALRNARAVMSSRDLYFDTLRALSLALETKDPFALGGTDRVVDYATELGDYFGLHGEDREALRIGALLHDIGMPAVGEAVLCEGGPLTTVEKALLKMHPRIAAEILQQAPALERVVPVVYHHHEWFDGQGYGGGLAGESIPLGARILAVADAYVAMTSDRPYRKAMVDQRAITELRDKSGTQFDPSVVDAMVDILSGSRNRVPGSSDRPAASRERPCRP